MEKLLMNFDKHNYDLDINNHETYGCQAYQNIIDQFQTMGLGQVLNIDELQELLDNPKAFVLSKMSNEKEHKFFGIVLKREKIFDMLEQPPAGFEVLEQAIKNYHQARMNNISQYRGLLQPEYYDLHRGKVIISEEKKKRLKEQHSVYATTEKQQAIFKAASAIKAVLDQLEDEVPGGTKKTLSDVLKLDYNEKKINVQYQKIASHE
jgi:hypothetical protein